MIWNILGAATGVVLIIIAIWDYFYRSNIIKNRIEVEAKVIRVEKVKNTGEGGRDFDPFFQYTVDGIQYERKYSSSSDKHEKVGFTTTVYCHMNNPKRSLLPDQLIKNNVSDIIILLFGVFLVCMAIFY